MYTDVIRLGPLCERFSIVLQAGWRREFATAGLLFVVEVAALVLLVQLPLLWDFHLVPAILASLSNRFLNRMKDARPRSS